MSQQPSPESNLARVIGLDIFSIGRWQFVLLMFIFISAIGVVLVTHNTRQMIDQRENLLLEKDLLDGEWRNLILEENALAEHSRVQRLAMDELEMKRPEPDKEVIIKLQ